MKKLSISLLISLALMACNKQPVSDTSLFESVSPQQSQIDFANTLEVNDSINFFNYGYYYMGGGVAIGDVNNDGLQDVYFTGNRVENKLYLNQGNLSFKDITAVAGVAADDRWITGVAMHDVNADGLMDIYLSVAGIWATTENILYINQGVDESGTPIFKDEAAQRGLADAGLSIQAAFFDADQDGDIDAYVANYEKTSFGTLIPEYKQKVDNPEWKSSDHLYLNNGDGVFEDATEAAGMLNFGLAVGVIATDFNNDGLTDLYVSNDFNTPDNFYFNNGDGTFTDRMKETTQHTAFYGMGVDAADFNNDGLMDLAQMDMTPADNFRSKANMASMNIDGFWENVDAGFHYQYMYNALQLNQGIKPNGEPFFAEVAKMSGIDKTDWSWACLFADYNNDGFNDLYVTNGTRRDINNKDFFKWMGRLDIQMKIKYKEITFADVTEKLPFKKIDNYMFKNKDGKYFERINEDWGITFEGFSNGAALADLDNDGDVELIVNNIDSVACIYKNNSRELGIGNYLKVKLQGAEGNPLALGARVKIYTDQGVQLKEQTLVRGYQSSVDPILHFGLGQAQEVRTVEVRWPDGKISLRSDIPANQQIEIAYATAEGSTDENKQSDAYFTAVEVEGLSTYVNEENDFDDFDHQILLPHRMSRLGPAVAKADVNGDGLQDIFIGAAAGEVPGMYMQQSTGAFMRSEFESGQGVYEDIAATFFDADGDGDQDLYVVSGGNDFEFESPNYQDRLYLNEGGTLVVSDALPSFAISGGTVAAADYDNDGDIDLFVGGRQAPRQYPMPVSSVLLENKSKAGQVRFELADQEAFQKLGMVTTATWIDLNQDKTLELVLGGEWMPISVFEQVDGQFVNKTSDYGLENTVGWWNTLQQADFDNDGDMDLIAGNLGLNYKYKATPDKTFDVYANDYDSNGNVDIVLGYYQNEEQYPVRGMQCSSQQIPEIKEKFKNKYNAFAQATLGDIYGDESLQQGIHYQAQDFSSVYIENKGEGQLVISRLPFEAQTSSFNSVVVMDYNKDGHLDFVAGGNQFNSEVETPRNDACFGWLFQGDGKGGFEYVNYARSGLYVPYDIRQMLLVESADSVPSLVVVSNNAPIKIFSTNDSN